MRQSIPRTVTEPFPIYISGTVVEGYKRGSTELGFPTANICSDFLLLGSANEIKNGIYCGFVKVNSKTYRSVCSYGVNPFYKNTRKSLEVHILQSFKDDIYSAQIDIVLLAYIRPELDYTSKEDLISDIKRDIEQAEVALKLPSYQQFEVNLNSYR